MKDADKEKRKPLSIRDAVHRGYGAEGSFTAQNRCGSGFWEIV